MMGCCLFVYYRKKRKQTSRDADSLSLCSLDINEPSTKRSKLVTRVTSLASLLPPVKTTPLKRIGQTLQRSITFRNESQTERAAHPPLSSSSSSSSTMKTRVISATLSNPSSSMTATRASTATALAAKRRDSKLWSETFDVHLGATQPLSPKEIKRQEAIFELAQGEQDLVEDLKLAKKAYHDPMLKLSIMTKQELNQIFGTLDSLIPLHEDLLSHLRDARKPDGSTDNVGHILTDWLPCLSSYTPYCSNQVQAKALLDQKKQDRRVQDFLQRCLQSPFSRKLDLWNFLDIPRSRLVKYPLLLREILKHTPNDHPDRQPLDEAMLMVQSVVADINRRTGESECQYYKDRLLYTEDIPRDELIERSRTLSCHGELKNTRGIKHHVFLFDQVLVITRTILLNELPVCYQICRKPIPIQHLVLEDLLDGEMRVGGSIRGAFSNNERTKNFFRITYRTGLHLQNHCFQASDAFNKQQWINCIRQAKEAAALTPEVGDSSDAETGLEDEKGIWEEVETRLYSEVEVAPRGGLSRRKKAELMDAEIETGLIVAHGLGLQFDETGVEMETGQGVLGAVAGPGAMGTWESQEEGRWRGNTLGRSAHDVPTNSWCGEAEEEEKGSMEEEPSRVADEGEEVSMETSDDDSLQCEELTHRC